MTSTDDFDGAPDVVPNRQRRWFREWRTQAHNQEEVMKVTESEHVIVRTKYIGQALRVTLIHEPDENVDLSSTPSRENPRYGEPQIQAELVIAPGHRLVVDSGGIKVESIERAAWQGFFEHDDGAGSVSVGPLSSEQCDCEACQRRSANT